MPLGALAADPPHRAPRGRRDQRPVEPGVPVLCAPPGASPGQAPDQRDSAGPDRRRVRPMGARLARRCGIRSHVEPGERAAGRLMISASRAARASRSGASSGMPRKTISFRCDVAVASSRASQAARTAVTIAATHCTAGRMSLTVSVQTPGKPTISQPSLVAIRTRCVARRYARTSSARTRRTTSAGAPFDSKALVEYRIAGRDVDHVAARDRRRIARLVCSNAQDEWIAHRQVAVDLGPRAERLRGLSVVGAAIDMNPDTLERARGVAHARTNLRHFPAP